MLSDMPTPDPTPKQFCLCHPTYRFSQLPSGTIAVIEADKIIDTFSLGDRAPSDAYNAWIEGHAA